LHFCRVRLRKRTLFDQRSRAAASWPRSAAGASESHPLRQISAETERNNAIGCYSPCTNICIVVADFLVFLANRACLFQADLYVARFVRGATH